MISISLNLSKINNNIDKIANDVKDLVIVTKCLNLNEEVIRGLNLGNRYIYDTRLDNLILLKKLKKNLLFHYQYYRIIGGQSSRVIVSNMEELNGATRDNIKNIYFNFDLGDGREGFHINEKEKILNNLKSNNHKNRRFGIVSNVGCFKLKKPTKKYFNEFHKLKKYFIERHVRIYHLSIGGSNCLPFLKEEKVRLHGSEARIGEAIFIGSIPNSNYNYGLNSEIAFMEADIIKKGKLLLMNIGYNHIDQSCVWDKDGIKILFQSSDMSSLYLDSKTLHNMLKNGKIFIPLNYKGLSRLSFVKDVKYNLV